MVQRFKGTNGTDLGKAKKTGGFPVKELIIRAIKNKKRYLTQISD